MQMTPLHRVAVLGALLVGTSVAVPLPVAGASSGLASYQPDGWVRYRAFHYDGGRIVEPTPWKGDNIYNSTGRYQTSKQVAGGVYAPGAYYVFQVFIQNEGPADSFKVHATGPGNWVVKYQRGKFNVTSAVVNGTYETPVLDGTNMLLKVKVWIGDPGTSIERQLKITSVGDPSKSDTVRIKSNYIACGC